MNKVQPAIALRRFQVIWIRRCDIWWRSPLSSRIAFCLSVIGCVSAVKMEGRKNSGSVPQLP